MHSRLSAAILLGGLAFVFAPTLPARGEEAKKTVKISFEEQVSAIFKNRCNGCHNADKQTSGVRLDHLDAALEDRHLKLWGEIGKQLKNGAMPPEDATQPTAEERKRAAEWVAQALAAARSRPSCTRRAIASASTTWWSSARTSRPTTRCTG